MKGNIIYIISAVLIVLSIIFALLIQVWGGFSYFTLSLLTLLALAWAGHLIYYYCTSFKAELEDEFNYYKAEVINSDGVTSEDFEKNIAYYKKQFNKKTIKDKTINICKIIFAFGVAGLFIMAMFVA